MSTIIFKEISLVVSLTAEAAVAQGSMSQESSLPEHFGRTCKTCGANLGHHASSAFVCETCGEER